MHVFSLRAMYFVACVVLALSTTSPSAAQDTSRYRGFQFDTTFLVGGYDNGFANLRYLTDTLHFNFTRTYGGPFRITGSLLVTDPSDTAWIAGLAGERDRWYARTQVKRWREIYDTRLKVINAFSEIRALANACEVAEAFYTHDPDYAHNSSFAWNAGVLGTLTPDTLLGGYASAVRVDSVSPSALTLVAGGMNYTYEGLVLSSIHSLLNVAGVNSYADSTGWFSTAVALRIEEEDLTESVFDTTELARMVLYVRDTAGQSGPNDCRCHFFRKFDSVSITRQVYDSVPLYARGKTFRDIIHSFRFPNDTNVATGNSSHKNALYHPSSRVVFNGDPACDSATCAQKLQQLRDSGLVPASTIMRTTSPGYCDFYFDLYSTRRVPLKFAAGRISSLVFTQVLRGDADTLMRYIAREFYADGALDSLQYRFEVTDETRFSRFKSHGMITAKFQNTLLDQRPSDTRGFWANPQEATRFMRVNTGDLDTTDVKIVHMMANQQYSFGALPTDSVVVIPMPAFYANPDSMDSRALYSYWRARRVMNDTTVTDSIWRIRPGDSVASWFVADDVMGASYADTAPRGIAYNTESDYDLFTERARQLASGKLALIDDNIRTARSTFSATGVPAYPVYAVVQVQGFTEPIGQNDWPKYWTAWAIPYPAYITMHSWMTIASAMDGMIYGDFALDGTGEFGVRHWATGEHSFDYYDSMSVHDPLQPVDTLTKQWLFPRMWYGFLGRSGAIESVMDEFHHHVLPVYCTLNRQSVVRRTLRDDSATVGDITMLAWAGVGKVKRYDRGTGGLYLDTLNGQSRVIPLPNSESDLLVSWHRPLRTTDTSQYLTLINLRQWPVDTLQYGGRYQYWAPSGAATRGFGARDVRRPMIALRNTSSMPADSCVVEQVGHEGDFSVRVAYGDTILLPFLDPGAGMMVRVSPIPRGVSARGVAYNNSQRVENPSLDTMARPRWYTTTRNVASIRALMDLTLQWFDHHLRVQARRTARVGCSTGSRMSRLTQH